MKNTRIPNKRCAKKTEEKRFDLGKSRISNSARLVSNAHKMPRFRDSDLKNPWENRFPNLRHTSSKSNASSSPFQFLAYHVQTGNYQTMQYWNVHFPTDIYCVKISKPNHSPSIWNPLFAEFIGVWYEILLYQNKNIIKMPALKDLESNWRLDKVTFQGYQ